MEVCCVEDIVLGRREPSQVQLGRDSQCQTVYHVRLIERPLAEAAKTASPDRAPGLRTQTMHSM